VICVGVLTYPNSPDYRPDIDHLSPVQVGGNSDSLVHIDTLLNALFQANVMDTVNGIELTEPGAPSHILRDMSEYTTLAFIASFDVPQVHRQGAMQPSMTVQAPATTMPQHKRITYIALAKMCMPRLAELFLQFKENDEVFVDGTVEAVLSAYAVPIKLKYECPPPSKFGKDLPLWKTATTCFLKIVKEIGPQINVLGPSMIIRNIYLYANADDVRAELSPVRVESAWRQVIDVYRGGILADRYVLRMEPAHHPPLMLIRTNHQFRCRYLYPL
jgi:hypothetical protein